MDGIRSWIGLDVGKADHHATVVDGAGTVLLACGVRNDERAIEGLLDQAGPDAALVIDQPGSIGALAVAVARRRGVPVAYVPGLVMRRASELYPGEGKTDRRDSFVIADTARIHQARVHWLAVGDELLEELRVLGGHDDDLAHDRTRTANRLRDLLLQASPQSSGSWGPGSSTRRCARCWSATRPRRRCAPPPPAPAARGRRARAADGRPARRRAPRGARGPDRDRPRRGDDRTRHP
ncbi:MAG: IS110 family transposase [Solirubrobacteraceae bacterium]